MTIATLNKVCVKCGIAKPLKMYNKDETRPDGKHPFCRSCRTEEARLRRNSNPEFFLGKAREACQRWLKKNPLYTRNHYAQTRYGMSGIELATYAERMAGEQDNKCAICGITGKVIGLVAERDVVRLVVDHDHKTSKPRGLLCDSCNKALGWLKEDKDIIVSLPSYIEKCEQRRQ